MDKRELDCGDNSCVFAVKKGGMRTNGGCGCFQNAGFSSSVIRSAHQMLPEILNLREQVTALEDELTELKLCPQEAWECAREIKLLQSENAKLKRVAEAAKAYMDKHCKCCRRSKFEVNRDCDFKEALALLDATTTRNEVTTDGSGT